jgi:hypothetical protein
MSQLHQFSNFNQATQLLYFPARKTLFSLKNVTEIRHLSYAPRVSIISKLINTRTSITQHLYYDYDFSGSDDNFLGFYDE